MNMAETMTAAEPLAERVISDVETLKALSDPVRLRILETMVQAPDDAWTVKRIAKALDVGPTKLYHHIAILEERELIRVAGTRVVSGIIQTSYRIAQLSVRLDRSLLSAGPADAGAAAIEEVLRTIFDTARDDVGRALHTGTMGIGGDPSTGRGILRQDLRRLTPEQVVDFRVRLAALLDEFDTDPIGPADGEPFGLLIAFYPIPDQSKEPTGD